MVWLPKYSENIVCITGSVVTIARKLGLLRPDFHPVHSGMAIVAVKVLKFFHADQKIAVTHRSPSASSITLF